MTEQKAPERIEDRVMTLKTDYGTWVTVEDYQDAADRIEELEANRLANRVAIMRLEAKLAKAVEGLDEAVYLLAPDEKDMMRKAGVYRIVTTLAELKGQDDE